MSDFPDRLYKYLPERYLADVVERGALLFRSLSYFRGVEDLARGDLLEAMHMDHPDGDITLTTPDGRQWKGDAAVLNRVPPHRVLAFCMSLVHDSALYDEFDSDCCIEFTDPVELIRRCGAVVVKQPRFSESGLLHGPVRYYMPNQPAEGDIKDPRQIPFFKHKKFSYQDEYRLALALRGGQVVRTQIINRLYTVDEDLAELPVAHRKVFVGPLADIVTVHRQTGPPNTYEAPGCQGQGVPGGDAG